MPQREGPDISRRVLSAASINTYSAHGPQVQISGINHAKMYLKCTLVHWGNVHKQPPKTICWYNEQNQTARMIAPLSIWSPPSSLHTQNPSIMITPYLFKLIQINTYAFSNNCSAAWHISTIYPLLPTRCKRQSDIRRRLSGLPAVLEPRQTTSCYPDPSSGL